MLRDAWVVSNDPGCLMFFLCLDWKTDFSDKRVSFDFLGRSAIKLRTQASVARGTSTTIISANSDHPDRVLRFDVIRFSTFSKGGNAL